MLRMFGIMFGIAFAVALLMKWSGLGGWAFATTFSIVALICLIGLLYQYLTYRPGRQRVPGSPDSAPEYEQPEPWMSPGAAAMLCGAIALVITGAMTYIYLNNWWVESAPRTAKAKQERAQRNDMANAQAIRPNDTGLIDATMEAQDEESAQITRDLNAQLLALRQNRPRISETDYAAKYATWSKENAQAILNAKVKLSTVASTWTQGRAQNALKEFESMMINRQQDEIHMLGSEMDVALLSHDLNRPVATNKDAFDQWAKERKQITDRYTSLISEVKGWTPAPQTVSDELKSVRDRITSGSITSEDLKNWFWTAVPWVAGIIILIILVKGVGRTGTASVAKIGMGGLQVILAIALLLGAIYWLFILGYWWEYWAQINAFSTFPRAILLIGVVVVPMLLLVSIFSGDKKVAIVSLRVLTIMIVIAVLAYAGLLDSNKEKRRQAEFAQRSLTFDFSSPAQAASRPRKAGSAARSVAHEGTVDFAEFSVNNRWKKIRVPQGATKVVVEDYRAQTSGTSDICTHTAGCTGITLNSKPFLEPVTPSDPPVNALALAINVPDQGIEIVDGPVAVQPDSVIEFGVNGNLPLKGGLKYRFLFN